MEFLKNNEKVKRNVPFFIGMFVFAIFAIIRYFDHKMDIMNTTVYAISYKYGFTSRGFLGSVLAVLNKLTNADIMNYNTIYQISKLITLVLFFVLFCLFVVCLYKCKPEVEKFVKILIFGIGMIAFPFFVGVDNFGRYDVYLNVIMILCIILIVVEKAEWLIVPMCALGAIMHHGFVFMNLNIILVLLFYKILMTGEKKRQQKYIVLFALSFLIPSLIFLYCEFFSHNFGQEVYDAVYTLAQKLASEDGGVHGWVLQHEILGIDVYDEEYEFRIWNRQDFAIFVVLFSPFIVLITRFFFTLIKNVSENKHKLVYLAVAVGPATMIPEFILKVDYGRYVYAWFFYCLSIVMCLIAMNDAIVIEQFSRVKSKLEKRIGIVFFMVIYFFMFMPFRGYRICDIIETISTMIFRN